MRLALLLFVTLAACGGSGRGAGGNGPDDLSDDGSGSSGQDPAPLFCHADSDCALAASSCCSCPEFAARADDPAVACDGVSCPPGPQCANNVKAACDPTAGCVLRCIEMACDQDFASGYAMDPATGCLSCQAPPAIQASECTRDSECVETRQDCCGCAEGGVDTAVATRDRASYDAALHCGASPSCPGVNACEAGDTARCVQGSCVLTSAYLPPNACGRADLMECPTGQTCILNRDSMATELGVGVCGTP